MKEAIGTGLSIEIAKEDACKQLGIESHEAEFEILQMPTKKTLGLFGGKLAEVKAVVNRSPVKEVEKYIRSILDAMDLTEVEIKTEPVENGVNINLDGKNVGHVIGRRGETLDSLQYLSGLVANQCVKDTYYRVFINIGDYRQKREKTLESLAHKIANKVNRTGKVMSLEPMNPYERRIIHTTIQNIHGVVSWSEGEEINRHIVIGPEHKHKTYRKSYNKDRENLESIDKVNTNDTPLYGKVDVKN